MDISPGTIIDGRYQLVTEVGEGGMGVVYRAQHTEMDRSVAIKFLKPALLSDKEKLDRFMREAQTVSKLKHQNIVGVYAVGQMPTGTPYIAMEYVEGERLSDLVAEKGFLTATEALPLFIQVCDGLAHAHENEIIHRDIKPSNIMIVQDEDGKPVVKVVDFGIAKSLAAGTQGLTQTGHVMGSAFYMSPGTCEGRASDVRSDVYSVGCTLFEVLTGKPPFTGETFFETLSKQLSEMPKAINEVNPQARISNELQAVIDCTLQKDPALRYQSMQTLRKDLANVLAGNRASEIPKEAVASADQSLLTTRPSFSLRNIGIACGVTALLVCGGVFWSNAQKTEVHSQSAQELYNRGVSAQDSGDFDIAEKFFAQAIVAAQSEHDVRAEGNYEHTLGWLLAKHFDRLAKVGRARREMLQGARDHIARATEILGKVVEPRLHDPAAYNDAYFRKELLHLYMVSYWDLHNVADRLKDPALDQESAAKYLAVYDIIPENALWDTADDRSIRLSKGMIGYAIAERNAEKLLRSTKSFLRASKHNNADVIAVTEQGRQYLVDIKKSMPAQVVEQFRNLFRQNGYAL